MDEIDWIKSTKKALILFIKIFGGFGFFFIFIAIIGTRGEEKEVFLGFLVTGLLIAIAPPLMLGLCYGAICIVQKVLNSGRTVISWEKWYVRDLPKHCSPAISSLIYDLKIDVYKDYTATILYLCLKKFITLIKEGDKYKLKLEGKKDCSNLGRCEKYVLDIVSGKNVFDENKFKQEIIKEAQEKELITDKKYSKNLRIVVCLIVAIILLIITFNINKIVFSILFTILGAIGYVGGVGLQNYISVVDTEYRRTKDGKDIALLLKGLKRYINEYTLIRDKEIDHIQLLEEYIPYAISLDEAFAVEEFIKSNEQYRDLIYNRGI